MIGQCLCFYKNLIFCRFLYNKFSSLGWMEELNSSKARRLLAGAGFPALGRPGSWGPAMRFEYVFKPELPVRQDELNLFLGMNIKLDATTGFEYMLKNK